MNKELEAFARQRILSGILARPEKEQMIFRRMYSPLDLHKALPLVVADMPVGKLDWAIQQISNSEQKEALKNG